MSDQLTDEQKELYLDVLKEGTTPFDRFVSRGDVEDPVDIPNPRREIDRAEDPAALRAQKVREFREKFANPYVASERGFLDAVIRPRTTRRRIVAALAALETKRDRNPPKKHGNIPL